MDDIDEVLMADKERANTRYSPSIGWCQYRSLGNTSPNSFFFYIVANVGPSSSHRPLAIALRQGNGATPGRVSHTTVTDDRVSHVLRDCVHLVNILTEPANRTALEAELSLAAAWYNGDSFQEPDRVRVPDVPQPSFDFSHCDIHFDHQKMPELPWADGVREFPFISTCLRLGLHRNRNTRLHSVQEQALGTAFQDDRLEYGMVVLDISDLDRVRYGIFGFEINYEAEVRLNPGFDWDPVEDLPPRELPVAVLEENRTRLSLSASRYMKKFSSFDFKECLKTLGRLPLVDKAALAYIWPEDAEAQQSTGIAEPAPPARQSGITTALGPTVESLVQEALCNETLDSAKLEEYRDNTYFQNLLLESLRNRPLDVNFSNPSMQLLRLAYAGRPHLNWVAYRNITYESVAAAIESEELSGAQALSLCIEDLSGSPDALFEVLSRSDILREICFLQAPTRDNDTASRQLFAQLCASPYAKSILGTKTMVWACAYSAPLQRKLWLPYPPATSNNSSSSSLNIDVFPVQHVFVRCQFVDSVGRRNPKFWPGYFFLGDALLHPERLAVGFIDYVSSVLTDRHLLSFATCSPSLTAYNQRSPGLAISPIPAENFAIPERCSVSTPSTAMDGSDTLETQVECWPVVRDLQENSWTILVSHEWYIHRHVNLNRERPAWVEWGHDAEVPFVRYAFIRARRRIEISHSKSPEQLAELITPENVEVVGLKEFLQQTAPDVDPRLLDKPLEDAAQTIRDRGQWEAKLSARRKYLSVLEDGKARQMLKDFLQDAAVGREHLRRAMNAKPQERNWYPDLLKEGNVPQQATKRNNTIFKSLLDPDVANLKHPLGTEVRSFNERALARALADPDNRI